MDLSDALGDWPPSNANQAAGGAAWPGQPNTPSWPGQPPAPGNANQAVGGAAWPRQPNAPSWPGQPPHPIWGPRGGHLGPNPGPFPGPFLGPPPPLEVPNHQNLSNGVCDQLVITITGSINPNPNMITVDLTTERSDIAFHFNPRFNENGNKVIVRNSRINQKWGPEERQLDAFPFVPGMPFEIRILCTSSEFRVAVNNRHLLEYKHRIRDLRSIKTVSTYNDVTLSNVHIGMQP